MNNILDAFMSGSSNGYCRSDSTGSWSEALFAGRYPKVMLPYRVNLMALSIRRIRISLRRVASV